MTAFPIRRAAPADVPAVAAVWESGWREAHLGHVPDQWHGWVDEGPFEHDAPGGARVPAHPYAKDVRPDW